MNANGIVKLKASIRDVPDFPKKGVIFKDITTLLKDADLFTQSIDQLHLLIKNRSFDIIVAIESRGFIFAAVLAYNWGVSMVPVRKPGKLPYHKLSESYELEYGTDTLEIHADAVKANDNVLIVDDLLATGGTVEATAGLIERLKGRVVGCCFLVELDFLDARKRLKKYRVESLVHYDSE